MDLGLDVKERNGWSVLSVQGEEVTYTRRDLYAGLRPYPVDICGAGDSFSAGASVALAVTGSPLEAARFGNLVASITIMKKGTGTATPEELLANAHTGH